MGFEKGKSGNPQGRRKKEKLFETALRMELLSAGEDMPELRAIARNLITMAQTKEGLQAINALADRMDGKVPQAIVGDDEEDPVNILARIERVIVKPSGGAE